MILGIIYNQLLKTGEKVYFNALPKNVPNSGTYIYYNVDEGSGVTPVLCSLTKRNHRYLLYVTVIAPLDVLESKKELVIDTLFQTRPVNWQLRYEGSQYSHLEERGMHVYDLSFEITF